MTRKTVHKVMWCLTILYGVTVGVMATLHGPFVTFAWIGAIALGLGWTFTSVFTKGSRTSSTS